MPTEASLMLIIKAMGQPSWSFTHRYRRVPPRPTLLLFVVGGGGCLSDKLRSFRGMEAMLESCYNSTVTLTPSFRSMDPCCRLIHIFHCHVD